MAQSNLFRLRVVPSRVASSGLKDRANVDIYRPFFWAGLVTVLTAGCLLGAIALLGIAQAGSYTVSSWTPHILAHANSQLFGWVGFFVIGFALQHQPPTIAKVRVFHVLAWLTLGLMAMGISLRFIAEPLVLSNRTIGLPLGVIACSLQAFAVMLFLANTIVTKHRTGGPLIWQATFVFASLFWLIVITIAEPFVFLGSHQLERAESIRFIAEWFGPLRDAQFLGFVAMMIFGVSLTKFSTCFYAGSADRSIGLIGFGWWTVGLIVRMFGWNWAFRNGMVGEEQKFYVVGGYCLLLGAAHIAFASGIFGRLEKGIRSHKFLRAAFGWLLIAGLLMIVEPLHLRAVGQPFSHAFSGAIRHAITVGFISQMIIGVGSHVAAKMNDFSDAMLPKLWPTFWLLNLGNAARVACEIGTDYSSSAFRLMGVTGFVELIGLALWGIVMIRTMVPRFSPRLVQRAG